ncbi:hypothetical protein BJV77DRAFT_249530 [Russula vinacea]|nr:hypothetical protein BJV77DRAFT_249530 [Russula vinacea]
MERNRSGAQNSNAPTPIFILKNIRPVYVALHSGTDASPMVSSATTTDDSILDRRPSSYPPCNTASHQAVEDASLAIQSVPHHSPNLVSETRPSDIPASHTTRNPADELTFRTVFNTPQLCTSVIPSLPLALLPALTSSPNVAGVDKKQGNTNISTPPMVNLYPHTISGGEVASRQTDNDARPVAFPSPAVLTVTRSSYLPYEHGFASLSLPGYVRFGGPCAR